MAQDRDDLRIKYLENLAKIRVLKTEAREMVRELISDELKKKAMEALGGDENVMLSWFTERNILLQNRTPIEEIFLNGPDKVVEILDDMIAGGF